MKISKLGITSQNSSHFFMNSFLGLNFSLINNLKLKKTETEDINNGV